MRVRAYDGSKWTWAGGGSVTGINYDPARPADLPQLAVFDGKLYAAWREFNGTASQIRLRAYDGSKWTWADGGTGRGINYDSSKSGYVPALAVFNGKLYAAWEEWNGPNASRSFSTTGLQIRVKAYDGSGWSWADGGASNGINHDVSKSAFGPELAAFNNRLYFTWDEYNGSTYQIRVASGF